MFDPVRHIEEHHPEFSIERGPLRGALSCVLLAAKRIIVNDQLPQPEFEGSVCHEGVHLDRQDRCGPIDTVLDAKREAAVEREAALRMVPFERLAAVVTSGASDQELAARMGLDVHLVRRRIDLLTDDEWDVINGRVDDQDWGAA